MVVAWHIITLFAVFPSKTTENRLVSADVSGNGTVRQPRDADHES